MKNNLSAVIYFGKRLRIIKSVLVFSVILLFQANASGQNINELSDLKVVELTDDQIRRFVVESDRLGLTDNQIERLALERGINPVELVRFKERIQSIRNTLASPYSKSLKQQYQPDNNRTLKDSIEMMEQLPTRNLNTVFDPLTPKNFGFDVFNNANLTFEPDLRLPTPKNYPLAADDELVIDVSGNSEATYRLKVSPEGVIRIPLAGPVPVNGLTIEQAKDVITRRLGASVYSDIRTRQTFVDVTLASIRSIKVTIIGEATLPGTYTLPSVASVYNALYACGGPNRNGSFRNIEVIRSNTKIAVIDIYGYLVSGAKKNDMRLMDQDVIKINSYSTRIELKGEVKKPGVYDVLQGETFGKILEYAGGFTDNAYTEKISAFRNSSRDRQVSTISEAEMKTFVPGKGDVYIIGKILNRFTNRVSVSGAVYRPGDYELKDGMTLKQLIAEADGIREDAFTSRAVIHRYKQDLSTEIISFDLQKLLAGTIPDIALTREDRINVYSRFDLKEGYYVSIEGKIARPGSFLYEDGMTVQDLVLLAGGLQEAASLRRVEVSRRVKNADPDSVNTTTALIFQQDISFDLRDSAKAANFALAPFDEVVIRPAPGYFVQKNAVIEGEVKYTGKYTLEAKNDRISDLVKRAGGLTPEAYLAGAVLVRSRNLTKTEQTNYEQGLTNLLKQNYQSGTPAALLEDQLRGASQKSSDYVGIDLRKILENPLSDFDLLLNDGDTLRIPKLLQTVRVNGEVLYPALVRYNRRLNFKDYILGAGGFNERSSKKKSYVIFANGSVKGTKSFLFFRNYPKLRPGGEIFVPTRRERERLRPIEGITLGATLVSMFAIVINALNN